MASPGTAPPANTTLTQRLSSLAQTLQFAWFCGHMTLLACTLRYTLAIIKFNASTRMATFSYRLAFLSAAATYGIVVYKAYRSRLRSGQFPSGQAAAMKILGDENVQYLMMALCWLYAKPVYFALFPFAVYSTFHFLTYLRTALIPAVTGPGAASGAPANVSEMISRFVKQNYDASMHLVANLELFLWARVFLWCLVFKNSWILLALYTLFLRARYAQSQFVRDALLGLGRRGDGVVADARIPDPVRMGWGVAKSVVARFAELTDSSKIPGAGPATPIKKES